MDQIKAPIVYEGEEKRSSNKSLMVTVAVASFLAAALCVVCVLGGIYVADLKQTCNQNKDSGEVAVPASSPSKTEPIKPSGPVKEYMQTYHFKNESMKESVWIDEEGEVAVYKSYNMEGEEVAVTVMDFKKGLMAFYSDMDDKCYMKGGVDRIDLKKQQEVLETVKEITIGENDRYVDMKKIDGEEPVRDTSLLPDALQPYCRGKEVFWIEDDTCVKTAVTTGERHKRACYWHYHCYVYCRPYYYYGYRYYCRYYYRCFRHYHC